MERGGEILKGASQRKTAQRLLLLDLICRGEGHLDADELYRRAREKQPRLSLSTVYRTLQLFKMLGVVEERHFDETHHHYEAKPYAEHHHLVCLGCGQVVEFNYPLARQVKRNVPEAKDFDVLETEIHITGYCSECLRGRE